MRQAYRGQSLLTGHPFTLDVQLLHRPRPFQIQAARLSLEEVSFQKTLQRWLWLAGANALLAFLMLLDR